VLTHLEGLPVLIAHGRANAAKRFPEFFAANMRNLATRAAHAWAVERFFNRCDAPGCGFASWRRYLTRPTSHY
jgi:hypothetical protein